MQKMRPDAAKIPLIIGNCRSISALRKPGFFVPGYVILSNPNQMNLKIAVPGKNDEVV